METAKKIKIGRIVGIALLIVVTVFIIILFVLMILDLSNKETYLEGKVYESIEELHADLVNTVAEKANNEEDFFPRDMVCYFNVEDVIVIISTYAHTADMGEDTDGLYVQFAEKEGSEYKLISPKNGMPWAMVKLDSKNSLGGNYWYYALVNINNEEKSLCFLYKDINEERSIYFDGNKTEEKLLINPFTEEPFYLCYAISYNDTFFNTLFHAFSISGRHTVEFK